MFLIISPLVFNMDRSRMPPVGLIQSAGGGVFVPWSRISLGVDPAHCGSIICLFNAVITNRAD